LSVWKRPDSPYWQIRFELAGVKVRRSSETTDKRAAEELEEVLRRDLWRQIRLGEKRHTWDEAVEKCRAEQSHQRSWERTERAIAWFDKHLAAAKDRPATLLTELTYDAILKLRQVRERDGVAHGTINREFAVLRSILKRCVDPWKMLDAAPKVPMYRTPKITPRWITREQAHALLGTFPRHTRGLVMFALTTGLRRSNVTGLTWDRVDLKRRTAYIPANEAKGRQAITVPLNDDAIAILEQWQAIHESELGKGWPAAAHRYVFVYRGRAPIKQVTTRMWRQRCKALGLEGVTFHTMRHTWASWQAQSGTPLRHLQELGGWATLDMPLRYTHLAPGHLAPYADRTLLGTETVTEGDASQEARVSPCSGGKGGTRTLDPGIMRTEGKKKIA